MAALMTLSPSLVPSDAGVAAQASLASFGGPCCALAACALARCRRPGPERC